MTDAPVPATPITPVVRRLVTTLDPARWAGVDFDQPHAPRAEMGRALSTARRIAAAGWCPPEVMTALEAARDALAQAFQKTGDTDVLAALHLADEALQAARSGAVA